MVALLARLLQRYVRYASRRPGLPLLVILGSVGLAVVLSMRIGLDPSFEALLPEDTPSVVARREASSRVGESDLYLIVVSSPDPPANYRFARALSERMARWPEAEWVMDHVDLEVFRERALLYMDLDDLRQLVDLVELRVLRGQCEVQGNCAERDLRTDAEREADDRRLRELGEAYGRRIEQTTGDRGALAERYPQLRDALVSPDGTRATVLAKLSRGTNDIEFARQAMLKGEALIAELDPRSYHRDMRAEVAGAYRSSNEYDRVLLDSSLASAVSFILVVLVVVVCFRRLSAVLLMAVSLAVGMAWAMGLTALTFPTLNTITAVIFGILFGMGIEYSMHFVAATRAARATRADLGDALAEGVEETIWGMLSSVLTTSVALLTLVVSHNRGFREFGVIGAFGVAVCLVSAVVVVPPVWGVLDRIRPDRRPLPIPDDGWMARRGTLVALVLGVGVSAVLAWRAPFVNFEYDLSRLSAPRTQRSIPYGDTLRTGRGTTPAVLLGDSEAQLRAAHRFLVSRRDGGDARLLDIVTIETFVPSQQREKIEEIERLRDLLRPRTIQRVSERYRADLEHLARLARVEDEVTFEDLPAWAQQNLRERNGAVGRIGLLYMAGRHTDARESTAFQREYGRIDAGGERPVRVAASPFIIADVVNTVINDGKTMTVLTVSAILLLLLLDLRNLVGALGCFLALIAGVVWAFGAAEWLEWKLGVFNVLVLPVAIGMGIDGSVHLYHRFRRQGPEFLRSPLGSTGLAIMASSLTNLAGFAGLLVVQHRGLRSFGQLAVLTIGFTMISVLGLLPGALLAVARRRAARETRPL
jgi:predicted RND superfamily exporter protein